MFKSITGTKEHPSVGIASKVDGTVDTRVLKNGMTRLRFRFIPKQLEIVESAVTSALAITGFKSEAAALDIVCLDYLSGSPGVPSLSGLVKGTTVRRLFRLFPDQYEVVRAALDLGHHVGCVSDTQALTEICRSFLTHNGADASNWTSVKVNEDSQVEYTHLGGECCDQIAPHPV